MKRYTFSSFIQDHLPSGVHVYLPEFQSNTTVILTDRYLTKVYYEFSVNPRLTLAQTKTEALTEIQKFNEIWNSPLAKAMREEE